MPKELGHASFLCDEEVDLILTRLPDPSDRQSFSQVCKQCLRVEGLTRSTIRFLRPDFLRQTLPRFPNLLTFETPNSISDDDLVFISHTCPNIETLNLSLMTSSFDLDLKFLGLPLFASRCLNLSKVVLTGRMSVTDQMIVSLVKIAKNLKHLDLGGCLEVSDKSLETIGNRSGVMYLGLEWCSKVTDVGLAYLAKGRCSKTLKALILAWCEGISDVGLSCLQRMKCLEHLSLANCGRKITNTGGVLISGIVSLKKLSLVGLMRVTDISVGAIARGCVNLEDIDLSNCRLGGAGVRALARHKSLRYIVLRFCNVKRNGLDQLVTGCPLLKSIVVDSETLNNLRPRLRRRTRNIVTEC